MKINAKLTISRVSDDSIHIRVYDEASHSTFLDLAVSLENFANAITGLGHQECTAEVRGLAFVGLHRITVARTAYYDGDDRYDKAKIQDWLVRNWQEDGWILDPYLGSQGSVTVNEAGRCVVRYSLYKFVPVEGEQ